MVQYGASSDYKGGRRKICELAGDLHTEGTVVEVLQESRLVDMSAYYPIPKPEPAYSGYENIMVTMNIVQLIST